MDNKQLYEKIMNRVAKVVKQQILNETVFHDKEDYSRYQKQNVHDRVVQHYNDEGYKAQVLSKKSQKMQKTSDPWADMYNNEIRKKTKSSPSDITLFGSNLPQEYTDRPIYIALQQRRQQNPDTFRIELTIDLDDIAGNKDPNKNTTYVAFVDKNLFVKGEMDVYVCSKRQLLEIAQNIQEAKNKYNRKRDNYGNRLTLNKTGKNAGLVLKDTWIKANCIDSFHLEGTPEVASYTY